MIEIYDISNGKLKYSAYTFWQLCQMVTEDFAYHMVDEDNNVVWWIGEKARELCQSDGRERVLERLQQLLEFGEANSHPSFASRISFLLGEIALENGQHESAVECAERAVTLLPDNVDALHLLARGFTALGRVQEAAEVWRKANGIFPSEEAYLALAESLEQLKQPTQQERTLRALLRSFARSIKGLHILAQLYRRQGKNQAAARLAQRIVDLRPEKGQHFQPFFCEFAEALIWAKYNYEARKVTRLLEFLDEEQKRNPEEWLSLLKSVMLYKLDKRLCREECCYELGRYFEGIGYDKDLLAADLLQIADAFGQEFSRGVARFINNRFAKQLPQRKARTSPP